MKYVENIRDLCKKYNIDIQEVLRKCIGCNAVIIKNEGRYHIYIDKELQENVKKFVLIHEIMHIKTNTFQKNAKYHKYVEMYVNFKTIYYLRGVCEKKQLLNLFLRVYNEDNLFTYIKNNVFFERGGIK